MEIADVLLLVISFVVLLAMGVPISFATGLAAAVTLLFSMETSPALTTVAQRMATGIDSFALLAIPFFILSGEFMNRGGIARRLIELAKVWMGSFPGGLACVNILACVLFGAISGSAVAAAAAVGGALMPLMRKEGYDPNFSTAVNVTSATTGLVIPPSNQLIVYSLAAGGVSITSLFLAGYLPGILTGMSLMAVAAWQARRSGYAAGKSSSWSEKLRVSVLAIPSLFLIVVVIGGIVAGIFTATEASAVAVLYTFLLSVVFYREVRLDEIKSILLKASITTAIVMLLIGTSMALSWVMAYENIPQTVSQALLNLSQNKIVILLVMNLLLLAVGTFMDSTPAVLIFTPIFLPVAVGLGIDPVHFGIIMTANLCIGLITPPVGAVLFVGCGVAETRISSVVRPLLPFYLAMVVALILITLFPQISLAVPRLFGF